MDVPQSTNIVLTSAHLLAALVALAGVLWAAVTIILSLVKQRLAAERQEQLNQIKTLLASVDELKKELNNLNGQLQTVRESLAVARDRLNIR